MHRQLNGRMGPDKGGTANSGSCRKPYPPDGAHFKPDQPPAVGGGTSPGRDLPDLVSFMMATGLRIGEMTGQAWDAVDLDLGTVDVRVAAIRVKGEGVVIKTTKTDAGTRMLVLTQWCVTMLRRRAATTASPPRTARRAGQCSRRLSAAGAIRRTRRPTCASFANAGFDWVTSHVFRKTVATVMDQAGLSSRAAADQLGYANTSMTSDVYFGRKVLVTGAAAVLEVLDT
jgi:integrase